jgi:mannosyltransferase OCH1-like enzyme
MIPKKIHYCWFGGKPLNKLGKKCLKSWKKHFPDYEIIEWNESNFDFNCCQYVKEAYEAKKWAFVSDYARYKILYEQGGIYFDTDVEVIKDFGDILEKGSFMGCENTDYKKAIAINPGLGCAMAPGLDFCREILDDYEKSSFLNEDGSPNLYTIVERTTELLKKYGLKEKTDEIQQVAGINIFPVEYFAPIDMRNGKITITEKTRSIHRYAASWESKYNVSRGKIYRFISVHFGEKIAFVFKKLLGRKNKEIRQ